MNQRRRRIQDFAERVHADPDSLHTDAALGSYIAVNPMADESEVLERLGLSAEACLKVDCYWKYKEDIYFVQVESTKYTRADVGLWARISPGEPTYTNLVAIVGEPYVTREIVHRGMRLFAEALDRGLRLGEDLIRIDRPS